MCFSDVVREQARSRSDEGFFGLKLRGSLVKAVQLKQINSGFIQEQESALVSPQDIKVYTGFFVPLKRRRARGRHLYS